MILERELNINRHELRPFIDEYKDIAYNLKDKKRARYCYMCDMVKNDDQFNYYNKYREKMFRFGIRPTCADCTKLSSAKKGDIRRKIEQNKKEQKSKALLRLKVERVIKDQIRKEARQKQLLDNEKLYRAEQELYRYEYFHEHGVYPKPTKSDNNIIYVWQHDDIYKIGVTSKRRGTGRIYDVANAGNMRVNILHYIEVDDALLVEKELLDYGEKVRFDRKFDGCTEFRYLSKEDLEDIDYLINTHAKL